MPHSRRPEHFPDPAGRRHTPAELRRPLPRHAARSGDAAEAEAQLRRLAYHDPLTGLPNRVAMSERIEVAIELCRGRGRCLALLLLDLDDFGRVNETLGHACGDELLAQVAQRLATLAPESLAVCREEGDTFLLLADNLPPDAAGARSAARALGARLGELFAAPFSVGGDSVQVTASTGVSLLPADATDAGSLVQHANQAMYEAKRRGRAQTAIFEDTYQRTHAEVETSLRVRTALARGEFELHYQPVVEIADGGGLGGLEALLRWNDPERGLLTPGTFLPFLDESQLVLEEITDWVFSEVCWQLSEWRKRGFDPRISFNIPARQLRRSDFAQFITATAALHGADLTRVAAEVTESGAVDLETIVPTLRALRDAGLVLSLDDFGAGYSSLWRLRTMPFSLLKTDISLMRGVPDERSAVEVLEAVISLGHALGMVVIVEGVEHPAQVDALLAIGARVAQGYELGRPVPAAQIEARWGPAVSAYR